MQQAQRTLNVDLHRLAEQSRVVRLPLNRISTISKIRKTSARLAQEHERAPNLEELADELEIDVEKIREAMQHTGRHLSMDAPFNDNDDNSLLDMLPSDEGISPDDLLLDESLKAYVRPSPAADARSVSS